MEMKIKLASQNKLVLIILVQLILIDIFLVIFFVNRILLKPTAPVNIKAGNTGQVLQKSNASAVKEYAANTAFAMGRSQIDPLYGLAQSMILSEKKGCFVKRNKYIDTNEDAVGVMTDPLKELAEKAAGAQKQFNPVSSEAVGSLHKNARISPAIKHGDEAGLDPLGEIVQKLTGKKLQSKLLVTQNNTIVEGTFIATTYDLSYQSCGKYPSHPAYGITFSGKKAQKGRTIAVDPDVIPLGSRVYIEFPSPYTYLNGWYVAEDTGSKVKGKIIDVFLGESAFYEMEKFGSRKINVKIIYPLEAAKQKSIEKN